MCSSETTGYLETTLFSILTEKERVCERGKKWRWRETSERERACTKPFVNAPKRVESQHEQYLNKISEKAAYLFPFVSSYYSSL